MSDTDQIKEQLDRIEAKLETLLGLKKPNTRKANPKPPEAPIKFPSSLCNGTFKKAWMDWVKHRNEKKQRLTPTSVQRQLKLLDEAAITGGIEAAVAVIERSILNGWTGLFGRDEQGNSKAEDDEYYPG